MNAKTPLIVLSSITYRHHHVNRIFISAFANDSEVGTRMPSVTGLPPRVTIRLAGSITTIAMCQHRQHARHDNGARTARTRVASSSN